MSQTADKQWDFFISYASEDRVAGRSTAICARPTTASIADLQRMPQNRGITRELLRHDCNILIVVRFLGRCETECPRSSLHTEKTPACARYERRLDRGREGSVS